MRFAGLDEARSEAVAAMERAEALLSNPGSRALLGPFLELCAVRALLDAATCAVFLDERLQWSERSGWEETWRRAAGRGANILARYAQRPPQASMHERMRRAFPDLYAGPKLTLVYEPQQ